LEKHVTIGPAVETGQVRFSREDALA